MTEIPEWKQKYNKIVKARKEAHMKENNKERSTQKRKDGKDVIHGRPKCVMCGRRMAARNAINFMNMIYCLKCAKFKGIA